jgi:hypothetical protein
MAITKQVRTEAARKIAAIDGFDMNAIALVEDVELLSYVFADVDAFESAIVNTIKALKQLIERDVQASNLKYDLEDWQSYHFQHKVEQGARADMRIIFRRTNTGIEVKAFGHRFIPKDIYQRLVSTRNS